MTRLWTKTFLVAGALLGLSLGSGQALASFAFYDAFASASLTITDIDGGDADTFIDSDAFVSFADAFAFGTGFADFDGSVTSVLGPLGVGDGITQESSAFGDASGPFGIGASIHLTDGYIAIDNTLSSSTVVVSFDLTYELSATAGIGGPGEDAFAFADIDVLSFLGSVDILDTAAADALFGPPVSSIGPTTVSFDVTVLPGEFDEISVFLDAEGAAFVFAIPEPSTLAVWSLLGLAFVGLSCKQCRK